MPISVGAQVQTIDKAKILKIDINVESQMITFFIGYGYEDSGSFKKLKVRRVVVEGDNFVELSQKLVTSGKTIYESIAEICYAFLQAKNLI